MYADMREQVHLPEPEDLELVVALFRMLADGTRLRLLWVLLDGEWAVQDLAVVVGKAPSAVSQHLAKLRAARLVRTRRMGTQILYRVDDEHLRALVRDAMFHAEHAGPGLPAHHQAGTSMAAARTLLEGERP